MLCTQYCDGNYVNNDWNVTPRESRHCAFVTSQRATFSKAPVHCFVEVLKWMNTSSKGNGNRKKNIVTERMTFITIGRGAARSRFYHCRNRMYIFV